MKEERRKKREEVEVKKRADFQVGSVFQISMSSYSVVPMPRASAESTVRTPFRDVMRSTKWSLPGSLESNTRSRQARSIATGSVEASTPISAMQGSSATEQQSQSTVRFFMTLI